MKKPRMRKISALICTAAILVIGPICNKEITPEERLMMDLQEILHDSYGKDYKMKTLEIQPVND